MPLDRLHMCLTGIWWGILFAAFMWLMVTAASQKTIVIAEGSYDREGAVTAQDGTAGMNSIRLENTGEGTGRFLIPLAQDTKAENVTVENSYLDREMHIFIKGAKKDFYENCTLQGDVSCIRQAGWESRRGGIFLNLQMDGIYECRTSLDGGYLCMETCDPHEMYELLVVVDSEESALEEEKETAEAVCDLLPGQLGQEQIRLYFIGSDSERLPAQERAAFVADAGADLYLFVSAASREDPSQYGICGWYNENYFIPEFGNVEFADIVTRNVTIACGNRAIGLKSAPTDSILQEIDIPAAGIELGNLSNEQERELLSRDSYREKLAQGIAEAIREVYTTYYEDR